ncbi:MAG: tRNA-dihydrouridine synthase [Paludibacteraceae bacterium]|nr:tRNA-dihydrouridine synthase [Paludibacteraceae bacterium]
MSEVTDLVFRDIVTSTAKPDVLFTEFISTASLFSRGKKSMERKLLFTPNQHPIVAQIWGNTPEEFEKTAVHIKNLGFDGIDINIGCPNKAVMRKGCGAALINNYHQVERLINSVRKGAPNIALSVKTRLAKNSRLTSDWFKFLLSQNIDTLIIHGRSAKEMSKGLVNWDEIKKAVQLREKNNPKILILGNGDVKSYNEVVQKHQLYGVDGVMIGRGIFHNPWIFKKDENALKHTKKENIELLLKHTEMFNNAWGTSKNFETMKKFFKVYVKDFRGANNLRQKLMETRNYEEFKTTINLELKL